MRVLVTLFCMSLLMVACKNNSDKKEVKKTVNTENLVKIEHGEYTEYYPGKKQVKFHGYLDDNKQRDGKWVFYSPDGRESSITMYKNGIKDGFSIVKYPNGAMHYVGEYRDNKMVGKWEFYDEKGNKTIKDFK